MDPPLQINISHNLAKKVETYKDRFVNGALFLFPYK